MAYQLKVVPAEVTSNLATLSRHTPGVSVTALGAVGAGVTVTFTVPKEPGQPLAVTVTPYKPDALTPTLFMVGLEVVELKRLKPFGPAQVYVAPATAGTLRFKFCPTHTGELVVMVAPPVDGQSRNFTRKASVKFPAKVVWWAPGVAISVVEFVCPQI